MAAPPRASMACIACRTRKVKCSGNLPCPECSHNGLACTFKPRNSRAASRTNTKRGVVTTELRGNNTGQGHPSTARCLASSGATQLHELGFSFDDEFLIDLLPDYEAYVYPTCPLLPVQAIKTAIQCRCDDARYSSFCYAYASVTVAMTSSGQRFSSSSTHTPQVMAELISRALKVRPIVVHRSQIDIWRIVTSIFLRITFRRLQDQDMTLLYHGETVSMLHLLGIGVQGEGELETHYSRMTEDDKVTWLRVYWVVFIYDRLTVIDRNLRALLAMPLSLPAAVKEGVGGEAMFASHSNKENKGKQASSQEQQPKHQQLRKNTKPKTKAEQQQKPDKRNIQIGFARTCELYRYIDDEFLSIWSERSRSPLLTQEWIIDKQEALDEQRKAIDALCPRLCLIQRVDLISTCQWLRLRIWQMATWKYLLRSEDLRTYMILYFPLQESSAHILQFFQESGQDDLLSRCSIGVLHKIFEVVDIASDLLTVAVNFTLSDRDVGVVAQGRVNTCQLIAHLQQSGKLDGKQLARLFQKQRMLQGLAL